MEILKIKDLSFSYPESESRVLDGASFSLSEGELCVLAGATGSGKSTLLRLIKRELSPRGDKSGRVIFEGREIEELDAREAASAIGFVAQKPEQQIVCDTVWHELAFGLENLGLAQSEIAIRVAEMASYFGIDAWYDKKVSDLSGGQKQLLNLAAVMVMRPRLLLLDEPTSQLDPIAATEFMHTVRKLVNDLALSVIIVEHRLEEIIPLCDRLVLLEDSRVLKSGGPREVISSLASDSEALMAMPICSRVAHKLGYDGDCPISMREGREWLRSNCPNDIRSLEVSKTENDAEVALSFEKVCFRYDKTLPDALASLDFEVKTGEIFCVLGGNGSGKSTALGVASGTLKAYSGKVKVFGKKLSDYKNGSLYFECLSLLPQDVQTVFLKNTVKEELEDVHADISALPFDISHLLCRHPYDLSGGEQQIVALAKVLARKPRLLLLDEPTKALDAAKKQAFIELLRSLKADGMTILIVTHDVEFAAAVADRCALFFRGEAVSCAEPNSFFSDNNFYTTAARRLSRSHYDRVVTEDALIALCELNRKKAEDAK
jgi:energy-coupling factor transport system ATP-binding protein